MERRTLCMRESEYTVFFVSQENSLCDTKSLWLVLRRKKCFDNCEVESTEIYLTFIVKGIIFYLKDD